jgi:hypothetical protein
MNEEQMRIDNLICATKNDYEEGCMGDVRRIRMLGRGDCGRGDGGIFEFRRRGHERLRNEGHNESVSEWFSFGYEDCS